MGRMIARGSLEALWSTWMETGKDTMQSGINDICAEGRSKSLTLRKQTVDDGSENATNDHRSEKGVEHNPSFLFATTISADPNTVWKSYCTWCPLMRFSFKIAKCRSHFEIPGTNLDGSFVPAKNGGKLVEQKSKWMLVFERDGIPIGLHVASVQSHEMKLAKKTSLRFGFRKELEAPSSVFESWLRTKLAPAKRFVWIAKARDQSDDTG